MKQPREALAELVETADVLYKRASHRADCKRPRGDQWCECGLNVALCNFEDAIFAAREALASATPAQAVPECTCAAKDMPFGRCCKAPKGWTIETGVGGFSDKGDRWVCVRHLESQCGQDFYEDRDRLIFNFLNTLATQAPEAAPQPIPEAELTATLIQRDLYHDIADELAERIAKITGIEIGEHSSNNDPWMNAKDAADQYIELLPQAPKPAPIPETKDEIETLRMQLVACGVAAMCNTRETAKRQRISRDNPYWTASYGDVCRAVDSEMDLREALEAATPPIPEAGAGGEAMREALDQIAYALGDTEEWAATKDPQIVVSMLSDYMAGVRLSMEGAASAPFELTDEKADQLYQLHTGAGYKPFNHRGFARLVADYVSTHATQPPADRQAAPQPAAVEVRASMAVPGWISVDERLPGEQGCDSEEVMLFLNGNCALTDDECRNGGGWGIRLGYFDADKQAFRVHGRPEGFVTHWQNLPAAPEGAAK